jgi:hypothetical protein
MTRVEDGWVREKDNTQDNMVSLKSGAKLEIDELGNVWYKSDIEKVLGKVNSNGTFTAVPNQEFTSELMAASAELCVSYIRSK